MRTAFFGTKQFRLFAILSVSIIVLAIFSVSAITYYITPYLEMRDYKKFVTSVYAPKEKDTAIPLAFSPLEPQKGAASSKATIYFFGDYVSPGVKEALATVTAVYNFYGENNIHLVWKNFSLAGKTENVQAGNAALCANGLGKFWEFNDAILGTDVANASFVDTARALGLNATSFENCVKGAMYQATFEGSVMQGISARITSVPAVFVNGRLVSPLSEDSLKAAIDAQN